MNATQVARFALATEQMRTHPRGKVRRSAKRLEEVGDGERSEEEDARQEEDVRDGVGERVGSAGFTDRCPAVLRAPARRHAVVTDQHSTDIRDAVLRQRRRPVVNASTTHADERAMCKVK